jgi:hypothetical protein
VPPQSEAGGQFRSEGARRVHRGAGKRAAHQDIHLDGQADGEAADLGRPRIDGGAEDGEEQERGQDRFQEDAGTYGHIGREHRRAQMGDAPDRFGKHDAQGQPG